MIVEQNNSLELLRPEDETDPNLRQRRASDPLASVWVGASAGTGKTKVLTDRVLRLLLPRDDGAPATPAHRILCLTYTKAAASEMALRINKTLGEWAVLDLESLERKLAALLGGVAGAHQMQAAQRLFADVMDTPGGLQIMTIHSFCQSVLGRFPLEASLPPNFKLLEEGEAGKLLQMAKMQVLEKAQSPEQAGSSLAHAYYAIGGELDEKTFSSLIKEISGERNQLLRLTRQKNIEQIYAALCDFYDIPQNLKEEDVIRSVCADDAFDCANLSLVAKGMIADKGAKAQGLGKIIAQWLKATAQQRYEDYQSYYCAYFSTSGSEHTIRTQGFPPAALKKAMPDAHDILVVEAQRLAQAREKINRIKSAEKTRDLILMGREIVAAYVTLKAKQGVLDFDDLILRTMDLLRGEASGMQGFENASAWIMYKLDQGLDHILIDEAQDTNPEHWKIIEALCDEFFQGEGAKDEARRSAFVVGDIKQSIYSFQRAAPEEFQRMQNVFAEKIRNSGKAVRNVDLEISFRTTQSVLRLVDRVFAEPVLNSAVGGGKIHHISHRVGQAGIAEIWPLFENDEQEKAELWTPPLEFRGKKSASSKLAEHIAQTIRGWIDNKEILQSADRSIEAGDVMVLVRSRSAFVDQLVRALKLKDIPVSGVDRMRLGDQLVVQDMLTAARFVLLPEDDLTLSCLLKSPFLGWSEEDLFALCYKRRASVWEELNSYDAAKFAGEVDGNYPRIDILKCIKAVEYLKKIIEIGKTSGAYEFFSFLLQTPCPADLQSGLRAIKGRLGEDALDPLEELLNAALRFGRQDVDTLQLFVARQENDDSDLKREMEESAGKVRIMTVHGSKGLQAPIVILPDTVRTSNSGKISRLLWSNKTGLDFPLWSPRKDNDPARYREYYDASSVRSSQEEARLLYVAMTRAADRLYIGGYKPRRGKIDDSWYSVVRQAFKEDDTVQDLGGDVMRLENPQISAADQIRKGNDHIAGFAVKSLPDWAFRPAPQEPTPPRPLIPSRPSKTQEQQQIALSPLAAGQDFRFRRGNVTHKLLQFLPELPQNKRAEAARYYLGKNAGDLPGEVQQNIAQEVMDILDNPQYAPFFATGSMAEVSLTGLMTDNTVISGQIDRLVVRDADIWILDYKTNRPPPTDPKDIPQIYRAQLAAYRETIAKIYPAHKIHCALLWTDGPRLMVVE